MVGRNARVPAFGFTERQACLLVLVLEHSGVCLPRQYRTFAGIAHGRQTHRFFEQLIRRGFATRDPSAPAHAGWIYHVQYKPWYRALGEPGHRHRMATSVGRAVERLMVLDGVLRDPGPRWRFTVSVPAIPADHWTAEYYPNATLTAPAASWVDEGTGFLRHDWGSASPTGLPPDLVRPTHAGRIHDVKHKQWHDAIGQRDHRHPQPMSQRRAVERLMVLDGVLEPLNRTGIPERELGESGCRGRLSDRRLSHPAAQGLRFRGGEPRGRSHGAVDGISR